jgi:hypothetical protein
LERYAGKESKGNIRQQASTAFARPVRGPPLDACAPLVIRALVTGTPPSPLLRERTSALVVGRDSRRPSEGPVGHWVDLDEAGLVDFNDVKVTTFASLAAAATSENGGAHLQARWR